MRQDLQWYAVLIISLVAILLAFWGFMEVPALHGGKASILNAVSAIFRFMSFRFVEPAGIEQPVQLTIARYLWICVVAVGGVKAVYLALRKDFRISIARYRRGHVIVVGLTDVGLRVVRELRKKKRKVVVVDYSNGADRGKVAWRNGATVIAGNGADEKVLRSAGVAQSCAIIACERRPEVNLAIAGTSHGLAKARKNSAPPLVILPLVSDPVARREISGTDLWIADRQSTRINPFSPSKLIVEKLFRSYHPNSLSIRTKAKAPTHVIIGHGRLAVELGYELLLRYQNADSDSPMIEFVTTKSDPAIKRFSDLLSAMPEVGRVKVVDASAAEIGTHIERSIGESVIPHADALFVCSESTEESLAMASQVVPVLDRQKLKNVPVFAAIDVPPDFEVSYNPVTDGALRLFGDWIDQLEAKISGDVARDQLAMKVHEYVAAVKRPKNDTSSWWSSPESHRRSSRAFADHILVKIKWAGLDPSHVSSGYEPTREVIEGWSIMEHRRWCAERLLSGWRYGKDRSDTARTRSELKPWSELSEEAQEDVHSIVRKIPSIVAKH